MSMLRAVEFRELHQKIDSMQQAPITSRNLSDRERRDKMREPNNVLSALLLKTLEKVRRIKPVSF